MVAWAADFIRIIDLRVERFWLDPASRRLFAVTCGHKKRNARCVVYSLWRIPLFYDLFESC